MAMNITLAIEIQDFHFIPQGNGLFLYFSFIILKNLLVYLGNIGT